MMKGTFHLITPLLMALLLSSCFPTGLTALPTSTETPLPLLTSIHPTSTPTIYSTETATIAPSLTPSPFPTQTATAIPSPSLEPEQARDAIKALLQKPVDCPIPCLWGIMPGQTTLTEAKTILSHLGLGLEGPESNNSDLLYGANIKLDSGLYVFIGFTVSEEIVTDLDISIGLEEQKEGGEREWLAFSPETMVQRYGHPSRVDLFLGRAAGHTQFTMVVYFGAVDTIIEYYRFDIAANMRICPLSDQFDDIRLWMGKNPYYPPLAAEPLEKTTDLTLETFSQLMTGNPDQACFNLKVDMFP